MRRSPTAPVDLTPEQCREWLNEQRCLAYDQAARNAFLRTALWVQQLVVQRGRITRPAQLVGRISQIARENPQAALGSGGQEWSRSGRWLWLAAGEAEELLSRATSRATASRAAASRSRAISRAASLPGRRLPPAWLC